MKIVCLPPLLAVAAVSLMAVEVGDGYDQVIAEKGTPTNKLEMGGTLVLNYPDQRIKLKDKKVVSVSRQAKEPPPSTVVPAPAPKSPPPSPTPSAPSAPVAVELDWRTDYSQALEDAREKKAKVFLFFTGSDWCGWCMRLNREVLATAEFKAYADEELILVELDFPRKTSLSDDLKEQNAQLARKFGIEGYPTVIVLDHRGRRVGSMGYQPGGPAPFIAALEKL